MADAFSSSLAARLLSRPVVPSGTYEASTVPYAVLLLSMILIATSVIRRALERAGTRRPKWARQTSSAFSLLRNQIEVAEEVDCKPKVDVSLQEDRRRQKKVHRRKHHARAEHDTAVHPTTGVLDAAERTASEQLEDQPAPKEGLVTSGRSSAAPAADEDSVPQEAAPARAEVVPDAAEVEEPSLAAAEDEVEADKESSTAADPDCSSEHPCSSNEDSQVYSSNLLLAHREIYLRIARGAPGLTKQDAPAPPSAPASRAGQPAKRTSEGKSPAKAPQQAAFISPEEVLAMEAPTRKAKYVVAEADFTVYVNADQNRYQIYRDGVELRSLAWGGPHRPRLNACWSRVQDMAAACSQPSTRASTRSSSADLEDPEESALL